MVKHSLDIRPVCCTVLASFAQFVLHLLSRYVNLSLFSIRGRGLQAFTRVFGFRLCCCDQLVVRRQHLGLKEPHATCTIFPPSAVTCSLHSTESAKVLRTKAILPLPVQDKSKLRVGQWPIVKVHRPVAFFTPANCQCRLCTPETSI
jgi:hypothetical protein